MPETQQAGQQNDSGAPAGKRIPGRPFVKGDPRIRQNLAAVGPGVPEPPPDGVPQQLADMRHVYERPAREDRTPGQRTCRKWLKADVAGFMAKKTALEAKLLASGPRPEDQVLGFADDPAAEYRKDVVAAAIQVGGTVAGETTRVGGVRYGVALHLDGRRWDTAFEGVALKALYFNAGDRDDVWEMLLTPEECAKVEEFAKEHGHAVKHIAEVIVGPILDLFLQEHGRKPPSQAPPAAPSPPGPSRVLKPNRCDKCIRLGPRPGCPACAALRAEREAERAASPPAPECPPLCEPCEKIGLPSCPACKHAFYD